MKRLLGLAWAIALMAPLLAYQTAGATEAGYTRAQVAENNRPASCWTIIDGGVYNLTDWARSHPGGSGAIYALCGIDGSGSFGAKHGGESSPLRELKKYYLGPLVTATPTPSPSPSATVTPAPTSTPSQTPRPTAKPVPRKRTIVCVKGKTVRKVTAVKPKCPSGFRRR